MAILKLKVEGALPKCDITGLNKKAVITNVSIDPNGKVSVDSDVLWIGLNGTELKVAIPDVGREKLQLVEKPDKDNDFPLTSKFKQDIEEALTNFHNALLYQAEQLRQEEEAKKQQN
jgi:hypothetical protein